MWREAHLKTDYTWRCKHIRAKILKRDDYTCKCCNAKLTVYELTAHHLNSCDWDKEGRRNLDNIVCLCIKCHKEVHHVYGYGRNTVGQFNEFINKGSETIEMVTESHTE